MTKFYLFLFSSSRALRWKVILVLRNIAKSYFRKRFIRQHWTASNGGSLESLLHLAKVSLTEQPGMMSPKVEESNEEEQNWRGLSQSVCSECTKTFESQEITAMHILHCISDVLHCILYVVQSCIFESQLCSYYLRIRWQCAECAVLLFSSQWTCDWPHTRKWFIHEDMEEAHYSCCRAWFLSNRDFGKVKTLDIMSCYKLMKPSKSRHCSKQPVDKAWICDTEVPGNNVVCSAFTLHLLPCISLDFSLYLFPSFLFFYFFPLSVFTSTGFHWNGNGVLHMEEQLIVDGD